MASYGSGQHDATMPKLEARQVPQSNASDFIRLVFHSSAVQGDAVYIDGGEINAHSQLHNLPNNNTLAIDLSQSWSPASVPIKLIQKPPAAPVLNYGTLWPSDDNKTLYSFGGGVSRSLLTLPSPPNDVWQFDPSHDGGSWDKVGHASNSPFASFVRPAGGLSAVGGGTGYYLGGFRGDFNIQSPGPFIPVAGMVSYDMSANTWSNDSASGSERGGTGVFGGMQYVPNFGNGIVVALGGQTTDGIAYSDDGQNLISFDTINVYNPTTKQWYHQPATNDTADAIPDPRNMVCVVGAQATNDTYEIFMYGGHAGSIVNNLNPVTAAQQNLNKNYNQVYVLSLPSFRWFVSKDRSAAPRIGHTCEVIGGSQMLSIGGMDPSARDIVTALETTDPNPQGLGILNMNNMSWIDSYNANAGPYTQPDAVKAFYAKPGAISDITWSSPDLKTLLLGENSNSNSSESSSSSSSQTSAGVIAGATIGSIAGAALIMLALWFLIFRPRRQRKRDVEAMLARERGANAAYWDKMNSPSAIPLPASPDSPYGRFDPRRQRSELPVVERVGNELPGSEMTSDKPGSGWQTPTGGPAWPASKDSPWQGAPNGGGAATAAESSRAGSSWQSPIEMPGSEAPRVEADDGTMPTWREEDETEESSQQAGAAVRYSGKGAEGRDERSP